MSAQSWKEQTLWSLPVYTGDVSGVCSALYELGGMIVMHDPSGCNSTYNTHDEVRWTFMESLIFLSGLTQIDAITGNDRKLIDDIASACDQFHPQFVAIANSPVPWLIGTDFEAICRKVKEITGIEAFHVGTNAMHDYTKGAGSAFLQLAEMLFSGEARQAASGCRIRVNVLGMTPLDFTVRSDAAYLRQLLEERGFEVISVWAIGDSLDQLREAPGADVNLVVSSSGMSTALWLEENFGIPYAAGIPVGRFAEVLYESIETCASSGKSAVPYLEVLAKADQKRGRRCMAGEPVIMGSLAADRTLREGRAYDLIPLTETVKGLIPAGAPGPRGEAQIRDVLGRYDAVSADPVLKAACQKTCSFEEIPHFALSGRMYLDQMRPIFG